MRHERCRGAAHYCAANYSRAAIHYRATPRETARPRDDAKVAVVNDQNRVHLQDVVLGHNLNTDAQIVSGLKLTDKIVASPSLGLLEGQQVKVVEPVPGYQPGRGSTPVPSLPGTPVGADYTWRVAGARRATNCSQEAV